MRSRNKTKRIAACALLSALSVILMMTAYFPYFTYCSPLAAGAILIMIVIEFGRKWAVGAYIVVSLISLLFGEKEAASMFLLFFGYYPILKAQLECIRSRVVEYFLKYIVFNIGIVSAIALSVFVFQIPFSDGQSNIWIFGLILLLAGNVVFLVYDIALSRVISYYLIKIQPKIRTFLR